MPFGSYQGTFLGSNDTHCVRQGPGPRGKGRFEGRTHAKIFFHCKLLLAPGEYKRGAIPPFATLLWSLLRLTDDAATYATARSSGRTTHRELCVFMCRLTSALDSSRWALPEYPACVATRMIL